MADLVAKRTSAGAAKRNRQHDRVPRTEYLAFFLAGEPYAAPVALIREILKPPPMTPVPRAPHSLMGIISVRGQIVTVMDHWWGGPSGTAPLTIFFYEFGASALMMLELGKPSAQTPRGSKGDLPARSSATMMVLDSPSVQSARREPELVRMIPRLPSSPG